MFTTMTLRSFSVFIMLSLLMHMVSAHPVVIDLSPRAPASDGSHAPVSQTPMTSPNSSVPKMSLHNMQDLYNGYKNFQKDIRPQAEKALNDTPSFMFIGCVDNRLSPNSIFNTPPATITSHNNIGNLYSSQDPSADAAVAYAVDSLHVQHIIVLGHYGCKGVEAAITQSKSVKQRLRKWIRSISDLYRDSRRKEIVLLRESRMPRRGQDKGITAAPPASDPGYRALVEENVKHSVKQLRKHSLLSEAYSRRRHSKSHSDDEVNVFVHGFVYDEGTGQVHDLNISFGPPGKAIPHVPFEALKAAQNYHEDNKPDKDWDFSKGH